MRPLVGAVHAVTEWTAIRRLMRISALSNRAPYLEFRDRTAPPEWVGTQPTIEASAACSIG
jgi:hypothetical protein